MADINLEDGGDTTTGTNQADTITGGDGDDTISAGQGNDTVYGGEGNDTIDGEQGTDTIDGGPGDDQIEGGAGNDNLSGGDGDDIIAGENGDDIIEGGSGDDSLSGGSGNDTFVFNFTVSGGVTAQTYAAYATSLGLTLQDGLITQSQFSTSYTAWLSGLISELGLGSDTDGDGFVSFGLNQNDASETATPYIEGMTAAELDALFGVRQDIDVKTGKTMQERYFSDLDASTQTITSHDGTDTIIDWTGSNDTLQLNGLSGLTAEQFDALFNVGLNSNGDTVLSWAGGSITFDGMSIADVSTFYITGSDDGWFI